MGASSPLLRQVRYKVSMLLEMEFHNSADAPWRPRVEGLGVSAMTLINWRNGTARPGLKSLQIVCDTYNKLKDIREKLSVEMFFDEVSSDDFAEAIGFDKSRIKQRHYAHRLQTSGPQTAFLFDTKKPGGKKTLDDHFQAVEGCYHGYRLQGRNVARFGLVVPVAVPITERINESLFVIIADISIPRMGGGAPYLYSGVVSTRDASNTWQFLQNGQEWRDAATLTTTKGDAERADRQRFGKMQTCAQSGGMASPVNYDIVLRRQASAEGMSLQEIDQFLIQAATLKSEHVDQKLRRYFLHLNETKSICRPPSARSSSTRQRRTGRG